MKFYRKEKTDLPGKMIVNAKEPDNLLSTFNLVCGHKNSICGSGCNIVSHHLFGQQSRQICTFVDLWICFREMTIQEFSLIYANNVKLSVFFSLEKSNYDKSEH